MAFDWDIRAVRFWGRLVRTAAFLLFEPEKWYGPVRSFLLTVGGGWVFGARLVSRRDYCDHSGPEGRRCPSRRTIGGIDYCTGPDPGCGGKCPKAWWWPFGWLRVRRRLRRWGCPRGHWKPEWSWVDVLRCGIIRAVAGCSRRLCPVIRSGQRAKKAAGRRIKCQRARIEIGRAA